VPGLTLPDFFTPDNVRTLALVVAIAAIVLIVVVMRFLQKLAIRLMITGVLVLVAFGAWFYRAELGDCARTCDCRVLGFDIKIPQDDLPDTGVGCADQSK